jgi:hemolysin III
LALAAGLVLIVLAPTGPAAAAAAVYAATSILLFTTSALYHLGQWSPVVKKVLRRVDHANVFLFIAGTYTPFGVLALRGKTRSVVLSAVWSAALLGAAFQVLWPGVPRWWSVALYIALGWTAALVVPQLIRGAGVAAFTLIAAGGAVYTGGAVVYALRRPNPSPRWFGFHEIFHLCTIIAFGCQYIAASLVIYRAA